MLLPQIIARLLVALGLQCSPGLTRLDDVHAPLPYLAPDAAASFQAIRVQVQVATGIDALASLGDALRWPTYTTTKPGVAERSWHKAGRAIDLDAQVPWTVVPDGRYYRVWLHGVDVTQLFLDQGWRRIPAVDGVPEWWHLQLTTPATDWDAALAQAWPEGNALVAAHCSPVVPEAAPIQAALPAYVASADHSGRPWSPALYRSTRAE